MPDINQLDISLIKFTKLGQLEIVRLLVEQGADINTYNRYPLQVAACRGHLGIVKYLLEKNNNLYILTDTLFIAVSMGQLNIIKYLIEQDTDNLIKNQGILDCAIYNSRLDITKYLVEKGMKIPSNLMDNKLFITYDFKTRNPELFNYIKEQLRKQNK